MPSLSTGLINSNQVLAGARRLGTTMPYVVGGVTQAPRFVLHDPATLTAAMVNSATWSASQTTSTTPNIISLVGGAIEFAGNTFSLDTGPVPGANTSNNLNIDLDYLFSQLCVKSSSGADYILAAVPRYNEPMTQAEAEAMGVDYFLALTPSGEFIAHKFMDPKCLANICEVGGWMQLKQRIMDGCASCQDMELFNSCNDDNLCGPSMLCIKGVAFILAEVQDVGNCCNPLNNYSKCEFERLKATLFNIDSIRLSPDPIANTAGTDLGSTDPGIYTLNEFFGSLAVPIPFPLDTTASAGTNSSYYGVPSIGSDYGDGNGPGTQLWKISSITFYPNIDEALNCGEGRTLQAPTDLAEVKAFLARLTYVNPNLNPCEPNQCGLGWNEADIRLVAREYDLSCCSQPQADQGNHPQIRRFITKRDAIGAGWLGRVNPIYTDQASLSPRFGMHTSSFAMHLYANPVPLLKFSIKEKIDPVAPAIDGVSDPQANVIIDPTSLQVVSGSYLGS